MDMTIPSAINILSVWSIKLDVLPYEPGKCRHISKQEATEFRRWIVHLRKRLVTSVKKYGQNLPGITKTVVPRSAQLRQRLPGTFGVQVSRFMCSRVEFDYLPQMSWVLEAVCMLLQRFWHRHSSPNTRGMEGGDLDGGLVNKRDFKEWLGSTT